MKRILSVVTAVVLLLTLTACGGTQNDSAIVGEWQADIDYASVINTLISQNDVLAASGATLDGAPVKVTYTFGEDGTMSCALDREQLYKSLTTLFHEILTPVLSALGGMTVDEYIAKADMTEEELLYSLFTDDVMKSIEGVLGFTGTYTMENGKLSVTAGGVTIDANVKLKGDTLTLSTPLSLTDNAAVQKVLEKMLFPLTLTKAA